MNEFLKVSVIIPCYNSEKYLHETLGSLEKQKIELEVILINDGSTDCTLDIIKRYQEKSKHSVIVINKANSGVSESRNIGIDRASGEYIMFLDSDDVIDFELFEVIRKEIINNDKTFDFIGFNYSRTKSQINNKNSETIKKEYSAEDMKRQFLIRKGPVAFFTFIYNKKIINENQIKFSKNLKYGEDLEFCWKYLCNSKEGYYFNHCFYYYRDNPMSVMNNIDWDIIQSLSYVENVEKYMKTKNDLFAKEFAIYMYPRMTWSIAKQFVISNNKKMYLEFFKDQKNVDRINELSIKHHSFPIYITKFLFRAHQLLFFYFVLGSYKLLQFNTRIIRSLKSEAQ